MLLPVIAAMLLLLLTGTALAELFASQQMQSALSVESSRAFWIAEGGLWHAAYQGAGVLSPVPFAGGSYTVTKNGNVYTATAQCGEATRMVSESLGTSAAGPLDVEESAATARRSGADKLELGLVSVSPRDALIESFSLSADRATRRIDRLKLDDRTIWRAGGSVGLPTGPQALNRGTLSERTVVAGDAPRLRIEFSANPRGTVAYTLVLAFADGTSSTITFTISW